MGNPKKTIEKLLAETDIRINGDRPWDIRVRDERFYGAVVRGGTLALGESYMAGWWDSDHVDQLVTRLFQAKLDEKVSLTAANLLLYISSSLTNRSSPARSFEVGKRHYDTGNDVFERTLDKRLVYTCAYWKDAKNLDEAQEAKLDLVCRKIGLKKGDTVLDVGCGWGSFSKFAAEKYGAIMTGVTVSKEQVALGEKMCKGLPVTLLLKDYRDVRGKFDHVVSIGIIEHIGYKNYRTFMKHMSDCLKDDGLFLLHGIGNNYSDVSTEPWIDKYIFPNGMLPSIAQLGKAMEKIFVMEDWHNFGPDYDKTLMAWFENFDRHWPELSAKYGDTFYRMWKFYLLSCAATFRARRSQLWQIVLSKNGVPGGYTSVR